MKNNISSKQRLKTSAVKLTSFRRSTARTAFLAALSLYAAGSATAQTFPENEPRPTVLPPFGSLEAEELNPDIRCGGEGGFSDCPIEPATFDDDEAFLILPGNEGTRLRFTASEVIEECSQLNSPFGGPSFGFVSFGTEGPGCYTDSDPQVGGEGEFFQLGVTLDRAPDFTSDGAGVGGDFISVPSEGQVAFGGEDYGIGAGETLLVEVCDNQEVCGNTSIPLTGVYLNANNASFGHGGGEGCFEGLCAPGSLISDFSSSGPATFGRGTVIVTAGSETLEFPWGPTEVPFPGDGGGPPGEWPLGCDEGPCLDTFIIIDECYLDCAPPEEGEGSGFTLFIPFNEVLNVSSIEVVVDETSFAPDSGAEGVFLSALESCDIETGPGGDAQCATTLLDPDDPDVFDGGDLAVITAPAVDVNIVGPGTLRIIDSRASCGFTGTFATAGTDPIASSVLEMTDVQSYTIDGGGVVGVRQPRSFFVSNAGGGEPLVIPAKACGVPRLNTAGTTPNPNGQIVDRDVAGPGTWTPFFDFVELEANVDPVASFTQFVAGGLDAPAGLDANGNAPYACQDVAGPATTAANVGPGTATLNQPLFVINARDDEIKYVSGVPGQGVSIDPVGRDISVGCGGSKRAISRRYSFLAWNLIHAENASIRVETEKEIRTLIETTDRLEYCVSPAFYRDFLDNQPKQIQSFYNLGSSFANRIEGARTPLAKNFFRRLGEIYFLQAAVVATRYRDTLQDNPAIIDGFSQCFATGPELAGILPVTPPLTPTPGPDDKPLNAYGDVIAQVEHLRYVLSAFWKGELTKPLPPVQD